MRRFLTGLFVLATLLGCAATPTEIGIVEEGSGTVRMSGGAKWKIAEGGSILLERDDVKTGGKESLVMRIQGAILALNENTHLTLGEVSREGFRCSNYWQGDLFVILEAPKGRGWLLESGAGKVLINHGVAILRLDPMGKPETETAKVTETNPSRLQIVVVRGEVVVENLGMAQTLKAGELGFLFTGAPPTSPTPLSSQVVEDFEWALDQTLGRQPGPAWPRPPHYDPPRTPKGPGEKAGGTKKTPAEEKTAGSEEK